jgi:hypothetical protein
LVTKRLRSARVSVAAVLERLQRCRKLKYRFLQVLAILGKQQAAGMRALRHRQIRRCPLVRPDDLLKTCEDAQQRIRRQRKVIDADVAVVASRDNRGRDDIGANGLQHQPDAFFEQPNPADGIVGIHDGLGIENIGIKPGEVPRVIGGCVRRPRDEKSLLRRKCAVDRVPVQLIDSQRQAMCSSQEPVAEKIDRLNTVGDAARQQSLIKSVFAM